VLRRIAEGGAAAVTVRLVSWADEEGARFGRSLFGSSAASGTMADAVYKSPDGGQHWLPHNVGLKEHVSFINQFVFHPTDHDQIYAATTVGAFYTKDGGREWEERMTGMKKSTSWSPSPFIPAILGSSMREPREESIGPTTPGWDGRKSITG
jgi:hypothetical protein